MKNKYFNLYARFCEIEKQLIEEALNVTAGNYAKTARLLGMSQPTLRRRMVVHDLYIRKRSGRPHGAKARDDVSSASE